MKQGAIRTKRLSFPDGSYQETILDFNPLSIKNVDGAYTITAEDLENKMIRVNAQANTTIDVVLPDNNQVPAPTGTKVIISSNGIGKLRIVGGPLATVDSPQTNLIERKYGRVIAIKTAINSWEIDGQLVSQAPITFNPFSVTTKTYVIDRYNHEQPDPSTDIDTEIIISDKELRFYISGPGGYGFIDFTPLFNRDFINIVPDRLYFRARSTTPGVTLTDSEDYLGENEWGQYRLPAPSGHVNPNWYIAQLRSSEVPFTLVFEVSETDSITGLIGTLTYTFEPLHVSVFIQDFSDSIQGHRMVISNSGYITIYDNVDVEQGTINFLDDPSTQAQIYEGTYYKVVGVSGINGSSSGNSDAGELDTLYSPNSISDFSWYNEIDTVYRVEIWSDISGSLELFSSGTINLGTSIGGYVGESFANPHDIGSFNSTLSTNGSFSFTPTELVHYIKFNVEIPGDLHLYTVGPTLDTIGTFYDENQVELDTNNDSTDLNFELFETVGPGIFFLKVETFNNQLGTADVHIDFTAV